MKRKSSVLSMMVQFSILMLLSLLLSCSSGKDDQLNILLITVDDMNFDTPGCFGGDIDS